MLLIPTASATMVPYALTGTPLIPRAPSLPLTRTAFAAAHVVSDPLRERNPWDTRPAVDWDATLAFRVALWDQGLGLLSGCAELGRKAGPGSRVVGCDDNAQCQHPHPKLTSIRCDIAGFGRQMAATLLDWLETDPHPAPATRTPVTLIKCASSP